MICRVAPVWSGFYARRRCFRGLVEECVVAYMPPTGQSLEKDRSANSSL